MFTMTLRAPTRCVLLLLVAVAAVKATQDYYSDSGYSFYGGENDYDQYSQYGGDSHYSTGQYDGDSQPLDYSYYDDYGGYAGSSRSNYAPRVRSRSRYSARGMQRHEKSYPPMKPEKVFVPVVIKKKQQKKKKIISVHSGFYVPGGTQMFGKFKDLFSCKKACEITPTCFSGDFNPWLGKCYLHSNLTACANMRSHKAITHFKKVPCDILETPRGYVVLGVNVINGIEIKGVETLSDCIKKCATAGGGIASKDTNIVIEGQVCCHIDYDFASHKCYFHPCVDMATAQAQFCYPAATFADPPLNSLQNPTSISITICPLSEL